MRRRVALLGTLLWTVGLVVGGPITASTVSAQEAIECAPAATPAASTAATTPAAAAGTAAVAFPAEGGELTIFAAASLTEAFDQMKTDLEAANPGLTITYNFAGSQVLVTQLAEGAEADVFASADTRQMAAAQEQGLIAGEPAVFVRNRLTVVVPADNPAAIESAADLAKEGVKLVLAGPDVPVGRYARQSFCLMGEDAATYGDDFVTRVAANVVSNEENVRAVLTKVELGEADAGVVYTSDVAAAAAGTVTEIEIPEGVNVIATYPIAPVEGGEAALARAFIGYVLSPDGQATLESFGFQPAA